MIRSQADAHRCSVANIITKTSTTEANSLTVILYRMLLVLCVYYQITCGLFLLHNQLKQLHSDKQYRCITSLSYSYEVLIL